jgi:hypothetical protein
MKKYSPEEMRSRWENGTMTLDEWTQVIEEHLNEDK